MTPRPALYLTLGLEWSYTQISLETLNIPGMVWTCQLLLDKLITPLRWSMGLETKTTKKSPLQMFYFS